MKKKIVLTVLVFTMLAPTAILAQTEVKVTLPSLFGLFGLGPKTTIVITNVTPFQASIIVLNEKVADLPPGASIYDQRSFDFDYTELPVAAVLYGWESSSYGELVGVAGTVLRIRRGQPATWVIRISDIRRPDGTYDFSGYGYGSPYPAPDVGFVPERVEFPRIQLKSTTAVQVANATLFEARVRINGREVSRLETGGVFYLAFWNKYDRTIPVEAEVIFTDRGRFVGHYTDTFYAGNNPRGIQYILDPSKIRR